VDPDDLSTARGFVTVLLTSITSSDSAWDAMFRRAPFLSIDLHPRARVDVVSVRGPLRLVRGDWTPVRLLGRLTVKETTTDFVARARLRYRPRGEGAAARERLEVRTSFDLRYDELGINVPTGSTRRMAGDGVRVTVDLAYRGRRSVPHPERS
jgi:polyisoprenoid-binding protein YceI